MKQSVFQVSFKEHIFQQLKPDLANPDTTWMPNQSLSSLNDYMVLQVLYRVRSTTLDIILQKQIVFPGHTCVTCLIIVKSQIVKDVLKC